MAHRVQVGDTLPVFVQSNPNFRMPSNDAPIIMIGGGTGVAPFRAFLQEREARGSGGRSWLFFGERNFRTDFLYQTEWQEHLRTGVLTRMDVAFSRDQSAKYYVQDRLRERGREIYDWLQTGAHVYVCGDAAGLAPGVDQSLRTIISEHGGLDATEAKDYLRKLQHERRYQKDVY
jgi:sulfite reductase (NADPH) flavoprotein alpha-component